MGGTWGTVMAFLVFQVRHVPYVLHEAEHRIWLWVWNSMWIAPDKRGYGLGTEVIRLLQEEARKNPSIHRLVAQVKPSNIASMKCFEKSGFTEEYRQYMIER